MIEIYGTDGCTYCSAAFKLAKETGMSMAYYHIDSDPKAMQVITDKIGAFRTVPQIVVDGEHIGGYQELRKYVNELPRD